MKKLVKLCMAVAMVGALATQVYAEKTAKIKADVRSYLRQTTSKSGSADAVSNLDMKMYTRLGASIENKGESWTGSATVLHTFSYDGATSNRERFVKLANDSLAITYGFFYWGDAMRGGDYSWQSNYWGAGGNIFGRQEQLRVSMPANNLDFVLGLNSDDKTWDNDGDSETAEASYTLNTTDIGVLWGGDFGAISLGVVYQSRSQAVANDAAGLSDSKKNSESEMGFGLGYSISDKMRFSFNYDMLSAKAGEGDALATSTMDLIFDMDMDDVSGLSAGYSTRAEAQSADVKNAYTGLTLSYKTNISDSGAQAWFSYISDSQKTDAEGAEAETSSLIEFLLRMAF